VVRRVWPGKRGGRKCHHAAAVVPPALVAPLLALGLAMALSAALATLADSASVTLAPLIAALIPSTTMLAV